MPEIVVDASVAAKWFLPEAGEQAARNVLLSYAPIAPDWLLIELAHVLDRRRRNNEVTLAQGLDAIGMVRVAIRMIPAATFAEPALEIAARYGLTAYDAVYVALAEDRGIGLITADRKLSKVPCACLLGSE